jgi:hypothetical protein
MQTEKPAKSAGEKPKAKAEGEKSKGDKPKGEKAEGKADAKPKSDKKAKSAGKR